MEEALEICYVVDEGGFLAGKACGKADHAGGKLLEVLGNLGEGTSLVPRFDGNHHGVESDELHLLAIVFDVGDVGVDLAQILYFLVKVGKKTRIFFLIAVEVAGFSAGRKAILFF